MEEFDLEEYLKEIKNIYIFDNFYNPEITKSCDAIAVIKK